MIPITEKYLWSSVTKIFHYCHSVMKSVKISRDNLNFDIDCFNSFLAGIRALKNHIKWETYTQFADIDRLLLVIMKRAHNLNGHLIRISLGLI